MQCSSESKSPLFLLLFSCPQWIGCRSSRDNASPSEKTTKRSLRESSPTLSTQSTQSTSERSTKSSSRERPRQSPRTSRKSRDNAVFNFFKVSPEIRSRYSSHQSLSAILSSVVILRLGFLVGAKRHMKTKPSIYKKNYYSQH